MNEAHRKALRDNSSKLLKDLDLTAELIAKLLQYGIFNEDMVEEIKSGHTTKERVQKMLFKLPRRGPRAFEKFCNAIEDTYHWLAEDLRKSAELYSHKSESETMTLKEMVAIHVHETFGNSKRLGEKDKKDIRKFLYKQLKNWGYHPLSSPGSDKSDLNNTTEKKNEATEDVQTVLQEVYIMITGNKCSTRSVSSEEDMESVVSEDNEATQVTLDMIKTMIDDLKKEMDDLKNINKTCFKMLGAEDCGYPLHEVLSTYIDREDETKKQMAIMKKKVKKLEKKLNEISIKFASSQDKTETLKQKKLELKAKCKQLEQMQKEHFEKQNTLSDMKDFWKKLQSTSNLSRPRLEQTRIVNPLDSVDGPTTTDISLPSIRPPQKSSRSHRSHQGHLSTRSKMQDIPHENHHHLLPGREKTYGKWNY